MCATIDFYSVEGLSEGYYHNSLRGTLRYRCGWRELQWTPRWNVDTGAEVGWIHPEMCGPKDMSIALLPECTDAMNWVECLDLQLVQDSSGHCTADWVCVLTSLMIM